MLPLALVLAGVAACTPDPTPKWVGTWEGKDLDLVSEAQAAKDPVIAASLRLVRLTFNKDRTFDLLVAGMPYHGRYAIQGQTASLTITSILGKPIEKEPSGNWPVQAPATAEMVTSGKIRLSGHRVGSASVDLAKQMPK